MSALKTTLVEEMKQAMRDRNSEKLGVVRFLLSEIKNYEIDHGEQDDAGIQGIIGREVKKMKDALLEFQRGGRQDLVDQEESKIALMMNYLPQQLSEVEVENVVLRVIAATEAKEFGAVMKAVMAEVKGQADGSLVTQLVKKHLAS